MKRTLTTTAIAVLALAFSSTAFAADPATGGTATISGGVATLVSDTSVANTPANDFGYLQLPLPAGLTLAQVTELSAEFNVTDDDCGGGSPRFSINYGTNQNLFVYFGPAPTFTGCAQNTWHSTGNLVGTADQCRVDTAQLAGGTQCSTWAAALALIGTQTINSITLVRHVPDADPGGEGQPGDVLPRPDRRGGPPRVQRALERERHLERVRQVRLGRREGAERRGHAEPDHGCDRVVRGEGAEGRCTRPLRRGARRRRRDPHREAGAEAGEEGQEEPPLAAHERR